MGGSGGMQTVRFSPDRWRPARAGLLNVWQYTNEVLEFERGRMVLYGPNGSGKTMALELLLPYLLDARGQPSRLSTSGADRGGLWSRVTGYEEREPRTGFLWLEFRRPSGATLTCGVRLRANASGGGDKHWFTTTKQVGRDLELLDAAGIPLGPERLREAIADSGTLWGADTDGYRKAVRSVLFPGRSEDDLDALIRTLLVVRQQNVSDGLSTRRLSELLSQALPPLDDLELGKVAEGFADLDRRRDHIAGLEEDLRVTRRLVRANRDYARGWTARVVQRVISATTEFDKVTRALKHAESELAIRSRHLEELEREGERLHRESVLLHGEQEALQQSDDYRAGSRIAELEQRVAEEARAAAQAEDRAAREREGAQRRDRSLSQARARQADEERARDRVRRDLEQAVERVDGPTIGDVPHAAIGGLLSTWAEARADAIATVRRALEQHRLLVQRRDDAATARGGASERLDEAEALLRSAQETAGTCEASWWKSVETWRAGAIELPPYLPHLEDPLGARVLVSAAYVKAREPLVEARTELVARRQTLEGQRTAVEAELTQWRAGREPEPEAPAGRRDRVGLPGAPLWRLLEFDPGLGPRAREGIEAALLQCGLLDAWVAADGGLQLDPSLSDVLVASPEPRERGEVPVPLIADPALERAHDPALAGTIERLIASIAWVRHDAAAQVCEVGLTIAEDGSWRTPHLAGRAPIVPARFIGAASREVARQAKIVELESEAEALGHALLECARALEAVDARLARCDDELAAFPDTEALVQARDEVRDAEGRVGERKSSLHDAAERLRAAQAEARRSEDGLARLAAEHGLPTSLEALDAADAGVRQVTRALDGFERAWTAADRAAEAASRAEADAREASARVEQAEADTRERRLAHERSATKLQTLESTAGKPFRALLTRLEQIRSRLQGIDQRRAEMDRHRTRLATEIGRFGAQCKEAVEKREQAQRVRTQAHEAYVALCREGIIRDAALSVDVELDALGTLTAQLESARLLRADSALGPDPADTTLTSRVGKVHKWQHEATQQLAGRIALTFEPQEGAWSVLRARQDGVVVSGLELSERLTQDQERARAELDQKQQELFEEILTGSLREHLKARLWSAKALVDRINALLGEVRSAAGGVGVSLAWEIDPDLPEASQLRRAKELLVHDSPISDGRVELDAFLRSRVEQVRADEKDTGDWRERLERVLDYRDWHRFGVRVHHTRFGAQPRPLASRNVSLSAGEKTIVMVLPLLVAVVAHYEPASEDPPCESPRLLLMDELFPKLDFNNKRQLMGLLPRLELDGVFTSDKDRCEYDTLDGIAIHLFQKLPNDKTTTTRMVWNGHTLTVTSGEEDPS